MTNKRTYMIDIETTGTVKGKDKILEIGLVEIEFQTKGRAYAHWYPTGRTYHTYLHYAGQPETPFAKQHMTALYKKCNETDPSRNAKTVRHEIQTFIHSEPSDVLAGRTILPEIPEPKFFMGWNASNFDIPMVFAEEILDPCYYVTVEGKDKEELRGDVHYRIYEQTGSLGILKDITGLSNETIKALAVELDPTGIKLPEGKQHDAIYDCFWQIKMQNGLIELGRRGWIK